MAMDRATEWSGKLFGTAAGLVGSIIVWLFSQSWRVCGPDQFGAKAEYGLSAPFAPMDTAATPFTPAVYCESALSNDFVAVLPYIAAVLLGLAGFYVGSLYDKREATRRRSQR